MIKFSEGELLDLLPANMKNDVDMICLSYATKMAIQRLLRYEQSAMTQNSIDSLPERILDVLAVELRSPYYVDDMDIEVKRKIVKNTLIWHAKAGTTAAVSEMIETVFGVGRVIEWPDFEDGPGEPGTFDIVTNAQMTEDAVDFLMSVIGRVKNVRSHVRSVFIKREVDGDQRVGAAAKSEPQNRAMNHVELAAEQTGRVRAAAGFVGLCKLTVDNNDTTDRRSEAAGGIHGAAAFVSQRSRVVI